MPRSFQQVAPGRIQIREGGGCMALFGLPFLGAGILVTLVGLRILPIANAPGDSAFVWPVLGLMGVAFTLVGGSLVFGRSWTTLDSTQRIVSKEWGLLVPMRAQTHRLDDYTAVILGFQEGDSDTADRFPVDLKSRLGANLPVASSTQYAEARAWAVDVARHLHLDIEDATTDHPVRLSAAQADLPLQHRLRLEHREEERLDRPPEARSDVSQQNGRVQIVIPMPRMHPAALAAMSIPVAIPLVMVGPLLSFFRQTRTPDPVAWFFLGFLILMFGILPASVGLNAFLKSRLGRTTIEISIEGIRIRERGAWKTKAVALISAPEIMDIDYGTGPTLPESSVVGERTERVLASLRRFMRGRGITIKTRQGLTTFGKGLADEEIRYLHSVVTRALVS